MCNYITHLKLDMGYKLKFFTKGGLIVRIINIKMQITCHHLEFCNTKSD